MPRTTISYGMGQYRYNKDYNYIQKHDIPRENYKYSSEYYTSDYQDVVVKLPSDAGSANGVATPLVQYGRTFYMRLTVPQSNQFTTTLNLKLCPGDVNQSGAIDPTRFQSIKTLIIPPTPENDNTYSNVILYAVPNSNPEQVKVQLWDEYHDYSQNNGNPTSYKASDLYLVSTDQGQEQYRYCTQSATILNDSNSVLMDDKKAISILPQTWKMRDTAQSTVTFDFVFSPKYNLAEGYSYLLLEIDRSDAYHRTIQYIDNNQSYYGTKLNIEDIAIDLYYVPNLLQYAESGNSQIQSGTTSLTHIGVWGHPEQLLAINGEEIRIGQSGFYELNDFTINQLGVIVYDKNKDRFTIDYEYKIIS